MLLLPPEQKCSFVSPFHFRKSNAVPGFQLSSQTRKLTNEFRNYSAGQLQKPGISVGTSLSRENSFIQYSDSIWASSVGIPKIVRRDKKLLNRNVFLKAETRNATFADICEAGKYQYPNHQSSMQALTVTFSGFQLQISGQFLPSGHSPGHSLPHLSKPFQTWPNSIIIVSIVF